MWYLELLILLRRSPDFPLKQHEFVICYKRDENKIVAPFGICPNVLFGMIHRTTLRQGQLLSRAAVETVFALNTGSRQSCWQVEIIIVVVVQCFDVLQVHLATLASFLVPQASQYGSIAVETYSNSVVMHE